MELLGRLLILILTLSAVVPSSAAEAERDSAAEIVVCPTCTTSTVNQAVRSAPPGSVIRIAGGTYNEHDITISKPLTLTAKDPTNPPVLDAGFTGNALLIQSDDVEISGLTIRNSGTEYTSDLAGIKVDQASRCRILDNRLENNFFGIHIGKSEGCLIKGNRVIGNRAPGKRRSESESGNCIHIWNGSKVTVENNDVSACRDGIYFEFVNESFIRSNLSHGNMRYGLHFMYSHKNEYRENIFRDNDSGVAVMYSHGIQMIRNRFENSRGAASYGLLLKEISDSTVAANQFNRNTIGAYLEGTTRTEFEANTFKDNGWALRVLGDTDSNTFKRNDFIGNTFEVSTNASRSMNTFEGNYWSSYKGVDLDRDGFGDDAYHPVRLTAALMEHYDVSVLLIHSLFFTILDEVESVLPVLTPETFKDAKPRMTPVGVP